MAPEVIRNEACSEKVDIYSYGVVAWELLTCEIPYKNLDQNSIMWGVGSNKLKLPIPSSAPEGVKLLLEQCLCIKPRNRPSFSQIQKHLEILSSSETLFKIEDEFLKIQLQWKEEIEEKLNNKHGDKMKMLQAYNFDEDLVQKRKEELSHATEIRELYEQKLEKANNLYIELNTVLLQLDERERDLLRREKALNINSKKVVRPILKREFKNSQYNSKHDTEVNSSSDVSKATVTSKNQTGTLVNLDRTQYMNFNLSSSNIFSNFGRNNDTLKYKKLMMYYQRNKYDFMFIKKKQHLRLKYLSLCRQFKVKFTRTCDFNFRHPINFDSQDLVNRVFVHDDHQDAGFYSIRVNCSKSSSHTKSGRLSVIGPDLRRIKQRVFNICFLTNFQVNREIITDLIR